ncbi:hypothetical protein PFISCL1PPCAC_8865, partial [Pristionchus fissidentatus]
ASSSTPTSSGMVARTPDTVETGSLAPTPTAVSQSTARTPVTIDTTDGTRPSTAASPNPQLESVDICSNIRTRRTPNT